MGLEDYRRGFNEEGYERGFIHYIFRDLQIRVANEKEMLRSGNATEADFDDDNIPLFS
jgi:hypothetical protein